MDWLERLKAGVKVLGVRKVGAQIGYSPSLVSMVSNGKYMGDLEGIKRAVCKKLPEEVVDCPVLGAIEKRECEAWQRMPLSALSHRVLSVCRGCKNRRHGDVVRKF